MLRHQSVITSYLRPKGILTIATIAIITLFILIFGDIFFQIKNVKIQGATDAKLRGVELVTNQNLILLDVARLTNELKKDNPTIKNVTVQKVFPQTLIITITNSLPGAILKVYNGFFVLDTNAKILQKSTQLPSLDLPIIHYYQRLGYDDYQAGHLIDYEDLMKALYFTQKLQDINIILSNVDIATNDMIVCNLRGPKGGQIVFSANKDMNIQTYELQTIVGQLKIEGKNFQKIDLRFDKPVVIF